MPLFNQRVIAPGAAPRRWLVFLHGILGSGSNWRTFAQRLVQARPYWGALLVDLRMHGASQDFSPPHTLRAAAAEVASLCATIPGEGFSVLGHSFGGKVALTLLREGQFEFAQAFILDSSPGPRELSASEPTLKALGLLESLPTKLPSREDFLERVEAQGFDRAFAQWLAMNLRRAEEGFVLRVSLPAIRALLEDYFREDLWPVLENLSPKLRLDVLLGGLSSAFDAAAKDRLLAAARRQGNLHVHTLRDAGHWLHVDDPEGTFAVVSSALSGAD